MEQKTKIFAEDGGQDLKILRTFDLPLNLLFQAFVDPEIVEQWMGTKVLKLECKQHGGYLFETTDPKGNTHRFNGVIHSVVHNKKIIRTFEMENSPFGVQLEVYEFEQAADSASRLTIHIVYESAAQRDAMLRLPFAYGINMAHNRLQEVVEKFQSHK